jgi:protocatechuate 3,4-dioxygenase beta subunit
LIVINDGITPAVGAITYLSGRILDSHGSPVRGALVEIWQADNNGAYLHSGTDNKDKRDSHFQGFGRFLTGSNGEYLFRTIRPVQYPGRSPHIHFAIKMKNEKKLVTQCYIKGHPANAGDQVLKGIKDPKALESVMVNFVPMPGSDLLAARWDVVLGLHQQPDARANRTCLSSNLAIRTMKSVSGRALRCSASCRPLERGFIR